MTTMASPYDLSICQSSVGTGQRFGTSARVFPDGVTMMVDWREDASLEYYNFSTITIDLATGTIESDNDGAVVVSDAANVQAHGPGTYVLYNSTTYRTDLFHVYSQPGVYQAARRVAWSINGQSMEYERYCMCLTQEAGDWQVQNCESGNGINDACFEYPIYIYRDGTCHLKSKLQRFCSTPIPYVLMFGFNVSLILIAILVGRYRTQKKALSDQSHDDSGLNYTTHIS